MSNIEIHARVYNEEGFWLTVRPSADFPDDSITLSSDPDVCNISYFGEINLDLPDDMWLAIAKAIIEVHKHKSGEKCEADAPMRGGER
jgi:hypothetical protein